MKKHFILATVLLASSASFAQQNKTAPPPPPPPPPVEAIEPPPPAPPPPPEVIMSKDYTDFLSRNKQVKSLDWSNQERVTIHLKSGKREVYYLNDKEQVKKMEDKYGELPDAPPPAPKAKILPPPPPPKPLKQQ